jgi:bifunctional DNA-binding transcriptional regulator/antitoxin component of YhaV-PrlF toxin-antitoxin module
MFRDMPTGFHPRQQGDLGEAAAIEWLTRAGAGVAFPLFHSPDYDLIADMNGRMLRVQVKTSRCTYASTGHYAVQLATSGGNQSWTGVVKTFDPSRFDFLFAVVADGRRWFIPSEEIEGTRAISLGGLKYSEFEVEAGRPLAADQIPRFKLDDPRGSAGVGEPGRTVNSVAKPERVRIPPPPLSLSPASTEAGRPRQALGRTRISANHQVTIPLAAFEAAGLDVGDRFRVEAESRGRVVLTRVAEYMERRLGQLVLPRAGAESPSDGDE